MKITERLRKAAWLIGAPIFILLASPAAYADCGLSLNVANITINWDLNYATLAVQFTIHKDAVPACDFGIGFTKGGGPDYPVRQAANGGAVLRYQLYKDNSLSKILRDAPFTSTDDLIMGNFPDAGNPTQTFTYYLSIPYALATAPTLAKAGSYSDTYTLNVYEGANPLLFATPVKSATVNLTVNVASMINIALVSSGGSFDPSQTTRNAAMGVLYRGLATSLDMRVRSNAGYKVTFSSLNNGNLKPAALGATSTVPYALTLAGSPVDLSNSAASPIQVLLDSGTTGLQGSTFPIRIVIGNMATTVAAGTHQDTVTITATTTE